MTTPEGKQMTKEEAEQIIARFERAESFADYNGYSEVAEARSFLEGFSAGVRASAEKVMGRSMIEAESYFAARSGFRKEILSLLPKESEK